MKDVRFAQAHIRPRCGASRDPELRRDLDDVERSNPGARADEFEHLLALPASLDLAVAQLFEIDCR
jgi:hypothetical protein